MAASPPLSLTLRFHHAIPNLNLELIELIAKTAPKLRIPNSRDLRSCPLQLLEHLRHCQPFREHPLLATRRRSQSHFESALNKDNKKKIPFTPKILQINSLPFFFCIFFLYFLREFVAAIDFFCNSHALLGESRGLENIFVIFTKLIPRKIFFCIANILVLMVN